MIPIPSGVRIWIATGHADMRKGMPGLSLLVQDHFKRDPVSGAVLVFRARRPDRVKIVTWDGTGLVMVWKALDGGFKWPPISDGVMRLSPAQLGALVEGLDWSRVHPPRKATPRATR